MKIATAIKRLRSLQVAELETGNTEEARAIEVAVELLEKVKIGVVDFSTLVEKPKPKPKPKPKRMDAIELATVDTMFLKDIAALEALGAPDEGMKRRELRMRTLAILDGTVR